MKMINGAIDIISMLMKGQWKWVFYIIYAKLLGIDLASCSLNTLGLSEQTSVGYFDSGGPDLEVVLRSLSINNGDAILDIGCGKGGAMITLSKYPFRCVDGVDMSERLISAAKINLEKARCRKTQLFCAEASTFNNYDKYNFIYMFNPFPCNIMQSVILNINKSISNNPRIITIIYKNPVCHDIIIRKSNFKVILELKHSLDHPFWVYRNSM
jgi:SAM-dependent methyltransferase